MKQPLVSRNPEVMGGTAVFHGTRVPVQTLLDYLEAGESIDDFSRVPVGNARACHRLPGGSEGPSHRSGVGARYALSSGRSPVVAAVRRKRTRPMPPDGCLRET